MHVLTTYNGLIYCKTKLNRNVCSTFRAIIGHFVGCIAVCYSKLLPQIKDFDMLKEALSDVLRGTCFPPLDEKFTLQLRMLWAFFYRIELVTCLLKSPCYKYGNAIDLSHEFKIFSVKHSLVCP